MILLETLVHKRTTQRNTFSDEIYILDEWFKDDARHRERGPASLIREQASGVVFREAWWQEGALHRERGPAVVFRSTRTGRITLESWWLCGRRHRVGGPAVIGYEAASGAVMREEWWDEDRRMAPPRQRRPRSRPAPALAAPGP